MTHRYGHDDEEAFRAASDELVARFENMPAGHDLGWVASQVLEFKWGYLDGDLARWRTSDVEEILLGLFPAKVMLDPEDISPVVAGFAGLLRFLGNDGIVPEPDAARAADSVEQLGPQFHMAAFDEDHWSPGKRLLNAARAEGVDISDSESLERFNADFNRRSFAERDATLGPMPAPHDPALGELLIGPLPPVVLASDEELEAMARNAVGYQRLRGMVDYVGGGRPLTEKGNLKLADGKALVDLLETGDEFDPVRGDRAWKTRSSADLKQLDLVFQIALESMMLVRDGRKVVPGPNADWNDDPLAATYGAWLVLLNRIGPTQHWYRDHRYGWDWFAEDLDRALPMILLDLYREGSAPIDDVVEEEWDGLRSLLDLDHLDDRRLELERSIIDSSLRRALDALEDLGIVAAEDVEEISDEYGFTKRFGGIVELTMLGKWAVQRFAAKTTTAPIVGGLREATAADLLNAVSDIPDVEAVAEVEVWVDHQGADAVPGLVAAIRSADETGRGIAFGSLRRLGNEGNAAVATLVDDPELWPYAAVWHRDTPSTSPVRIDCAGDPERFVRLLAAAIELWGPEAAAETWANPVAGDDGLAVMLDRAWRVQRPETEQVLAAIGAGRSDKAVAKAARKALFKHRSVS